MLLVLWKHNSQWERTGSVVERLTQDRRAVGSSLTGVTASLRCVLEQDTFILA